MVETYGEKHTGKIYNVDQSKCISTGHLSAHQKLKTPKGKWNQITDHLAKINI